MPDDGTTLTSEVAQENSTDTGSASADSQVSAASDAATTSADAGAVDTASQTSDGTGSLTDGAETHETQPPAAAKPEFTPEQAKRWREQAAGFTKAQQRAIELERKSQEMEQRLAQFEAQQKSASLPMWDPQSPEHANFNRALERRNDLNRWLQNAKSPEQAEYIKAIAAQEFSPELRKAIHGYEAHLEAQTREFLTNPRAAMAKYVQEMAPQLIDQKMGMAAQSWQQQEAARQQVGTWFNDQANADVVKGQGPWMAEELQKPGANWETVRLQAELRHWKSKVSGADQAAQSAEEKERLLRGNAASTVTSSPKSKTKVDAYQVAKSKGIIPATPQWFDLCLNLERQGLL